MLCRSVSWPPSASPSVASRPLQFWRDFREKGSASSWWLEQHERFSIRLWPASANCGKSHSDDGNREERTRLLHAYNLLINLSDNVFQRHRCRY